MSLKESKKRSKVFSGKCKWKYFGKIFSFQDKPIKFTACSNCLKLLWWTKTTGSTNWTKTRNQGKKKEIEPLHKKLFFSKDRKRMEKYLTKKSRKEGENFRVSLTDIFTNIFCTFPKSTLKENKIINYYQIQTTILTNQWNKRELMHCDKLQTKKLLLS